MARPVERDEIPPAGDWPLRASHDSTVPRIRRSRTPASHRRARGSLSAGRQPQECVQCSFSSGAWSNSHCKVSVRVHAQMFTDCAMFTIAPYDTIRPPIRQDASACTVAREQANAYLRASSSRRCPCRCLHQPRSADASPSWPLLPRSVWPSERVRKLRPFGQRSFHRTARARDGAHRQTPSGRSLIR